jgi:hypothetical protein
MRPNPVKKTETKRIVRLNERGAFKLSEACQYLGGLSVPTVKRLKKRGLLKPVPAIRHLLFSKAELDRFLSERPSQKAA